MNCMIFLLFNFHLIYFLDFFLFFIIIYYCLLEAYTLFCLKAYASITSFGKNASTPPLPFQNSTVYVEHDRHVVYMHHM